MSIHHRSNLTAWALALALFMPASAQAALVTAAGQGADERSALHDAMRQTPACAAPSSRARAMQRDASRS